MLLRALPGRNAKGRFAGGEPEEGIRGQRCGGGKSMSGGGGTVLSSRAIEGAPQSSPFNRKTSDRED